MKKMIACIIAMLLLLATVSVSVSAYAQEKPTVKEALEEIQTQQGFIHGETAYVTGNCYAFAAAVCERLYGVTYMGEGLYDSYKSYHRSGNYYTVNEMTTGDTLNAETVEEIKTFFLENAYPGDVIHYGRPGGGTHTFMVQSVDEEKLTVFQSNWPRRDMSRATCHIDDIYWDSLAESDRSVYNEDGSLYSMNEIFSNRMRSGAIGISVNRYVGYEDMYALDAAEPANELPQPQTFEEAIKPAQDEITAELMPCYNASAPSQYEELDMFLF